MPFNKYSVNTQYLLSLYIIMKIFQCDLVLSIERLNIMYVVYI